MIPLRGDIIRTKYGGKHKGIYVVWWVLISAAPRNTLYFEYDVRRLFLIVFSGQSPATFPPDTTQVSVDGTLGA